MLKWLVTRGQGGDSGDNSLQESPQQPPLSQHQYHQQHLLPSSIKELHQQQQPNNIINAQANDRFNDGSDGSIRIGSFQSKIKKFNNAIHLRDSSTNNTKLVPDKNTKSCKTSQPSSHGALSAVSGFSEILEVVERKAREREPHLASKNTQKNTMNLPRQHIFSKVSSSISGGKKNLQVLLTSSDITNLAPGAKFQGAYVTDDPLATLSNRKGARGGSTLEEIYAVSRYVP